MRTNTYSSPNTNTQSNTLSKKKVMLAQSQCKVSRPKLVGQSKVTTSDQREVFSVQSPRQNVSNTSNQEIDSMHSDDSSFKENET